jgi:lipopolysaccharide transport system ATP-binding protein
MTDFAIRVNRLGKRYSIREQQGYDTLRDAIAGTVGGWLARWKPNSQSALRAFSQDASCTANARSQAHDRVPSLASHDDIWALKDVSFEIKHGEVVGIVGRNGAGKSTLLKILSRITEPSEGIAEVYGRIGSLLEVGTGFHPDLTGRENIYLNGTILGMKKKEIEQQFDDIVAFAEVEKFIDTPVKRYSSGMYVRLAFAVAAHLDPEILLVDEVLAVGDAPFQRRCLSKMQDAAREGRTVFFISHHMESVRQLCRRCLWLGQGKLLMDRETEIVVNQYLLDSYGQSSSYYMAADVEPSSAEQQARLLQAEVFDVNEQQSDQLRFGESFAIRIVWEHFSDIPGVSYSIRVYDELSRFLFAANTIGTPLKIEAKGIHAVQCQFEPNILVPGVYYLSIGAYVRPYTTIYVAERCLRLVVSSMPYREDNPFNIVGRPLVAVHPKWSMRRKS